MNTSPIPGSDVASLPGVTDVEQATEHSEVNASAASSIEEYSPPPVEGTESLQLLTDCNFDVQLVQEAAQWIENGVSLPPAQLDEIDTREKASGLSELRGLWGDKFDSNLKAVKTFVNERLSPGARHLIQHGRRSDGRPFGSDPAVLQSILPVALRAGGQHHKGDVNTQIQEIETFMRSNRSAYNKDNAMQARYRELLSKKYGA